MSLMAVAALIDRAYQVSLQQLGHPPADPLRFRRLVAEQVLHRLRQQQPAPRRHLTPSRSAIASTVRCSRPAHSGGSASFVCGPNVRTMGCPRACAYSFRSSQLLGMPPVSQRLMVDVA